MISSRLSIITHCLPKAGLPMEKSSINNKNDGNSNNTAWKWMANTFWSLILIFERHLVRASGEEGTADWRTGSRGKCLGAICWSGELQHQMHSFSWDGNGWCPPLAGYCAIQSEVLCTGRLNRAGRSLSFSLLLLENIISIVAIINYQIMTIVLIITNSCQRDLISQYKVLPIRSRNSPPKAGISHCYYNWMSASG